MKRFIISSLIAVTTIEAGLQAGEIRNREINQQDWIAHGVYSGQLTARETDRIENKEANLNREIARDRFQNGGNLTNNERRQINRQQSTLSRDIYRDKHSAFARS